MAESDETIYIRQRKIMIENSWKTFQIPEETGLSPDVAVVHVRTDAGKTNVSKLTSFRYNKETYSAYKATQN